MDMDIQGHGRGHGIIEALGGSTGSKKGGKEPAASKPSRYPHPDGNPKLHLSNKLSSNTKVGADCWRCVKGHLHGAHRLPFKKKKRTKSIDFFG